MCCWVSEGIPGGGPYRAAVGMHDPLTVEHLHSARNMLSIYCRGSEFCREYMGLVEEASRLVAVARIHDLGGDYRGIDMGIIEGVGRMIEFYARYLSGMYVTVGEMVLSRFNEVLTLDGILYMRGDITLLDPGRAVTLYASGVIEPVESIPARIRL